MDKSVNSSKKEWREADQKQLEEPREDSPGSKFTSSLSSFKKPSVRLVWVKSAKKPQDKKEKEAIGESEGKHPVVKPFLPSIRSELSSPVIEAILVESTIDSTESSEPIIRCQYKKSNTVRSVWVECVKMPPELSKTLRMEPIEDLLDGQTLDAPPPSSSSDSGEYGKESPKKAKGMHKGKLPVYKIPKHLMELIEMDMVPEVLTMPLTSSTYADYFASLLYAEDFYIEKWSNFMLYRITLELDEKQMKKEKEKKQNVLNIGQKDEKLYLSLEITSIPMRRPYLLSRDFVFVRRSGKKSKPFEGKLLRVIKSSRVLVEFGDDFLPQYSPLHKYDVRFSFNRTCLKRCHEAVEAALLNPSFQDILFPPPSLAFPDPATPLNQGLDHDQASVIHKILSLRGPLPYLIKGPPSVTKQKDLSVVGSTVFEAVLQIYRNSPSCRILVTSPKNRTCDTIIRCLNEVIPDSELFRANAAFREIEDVPDGILPLCSYDGECFSDPPLTDLWAFKVIISTFMTSFRLHSSGVAAGHFTHIFMVDASSATEPETMVPLANLMGDQTSVVITGSLKNHTDRVRSDIARKNGLKRSYFHRLLESEPYSSNHPDFVSQLG